MPALSDGEIAARLLSDDRLWSEVGVDVNARSATGQQARQERNERSYSSCMHVSGLLAGGGVQEKPEDEPEDGRRDEDRKERQELGDGVGLHAAFLYRSTQR